MMFVSGMYFSDLLFLSAIRYNGRRLSSLRPKNDRVILPKQRKIPYVPLNKATDTVSIGLRTRQIMLAGFNILKNCENVN